MADNANLVAASQEILSFVLQLEQILFAELQKALDDPESATLPTLPRFSVSDGG